MEIKKKSFKEKVQEFYAKNKELISKNPKEFPSRFLSHIGAKERDFYFLLAGRTGVGKSSTINMLMGKKVAPTNEYEAETMDVKVYDSKICGVKLHVIDTPGLADDTEEVGKDEKYIRKMKEDIKKFDCLWFVTKLDDTRVRLDEKRALDILTRSLGGNIWKHALIVFTFADKVKTEKFEERLSKRTKLIREEIQKTIQKTFKRLNISISDKEIAYNIPSVAVSNEDDILPNEKEWLPELYSLTFTRIKEDGLLTFIELTKDDLSFEEQSEKRKHSDEEQTKDVPFEKKKKKKKKKKKRIHLNLKQGKRVKETLFDKVGRWIGSGLKVGRSIVSGLKSLLGG